MKPLKSSNKYEGVVKEKISRNQVKEAGGAI